LAKNLQQKDAPEAYMMYALYDSDSVMYKTGKQVLTKNAANRHEVLEEDLYISEYGYMEAFLVNETQEDVWFDDFSIQSTSSFIVQETHYDPWGLELTGLGFQAGGGVKVNRYLYNGKELQNELGLEWYDYGARMYDPAVGRWFVVEQLADDIMQVDKSPYQYGWNNPVNLTDPDGNCPWCVGAVVGILTDIAIQTAEIALSDNKSFSKDFKVTSVIVSGVAGATGAGLATKLTKVGTLAKIGIEAIHDGAASAAYQYTKNGEVNPREIAIDATFGKAIGDVAGNVVGKSAKNTPEAKILKRESDRAHNIAKGNPRASRVEKAEQAQKKMDNYVERRATAASVSAAGVGSEVVKNIE